MVIFVVVIVEYWGYVRSTIDWCYDLRKNLINIDAVTTRS